MKDKKRELEDLTTILLRSLLFFIIICWIMPIAPIIVTCLLDLPFNYFLFIWLGGMPLPIILLYYLVKKH